MVEGDGSCDVTIEKVGTTRKNITVRLRTLTVQEYEYATGNTIYFIDNINSAECKSNLLLSKTITK